MWQIFSILKKRLHVPARWPWTYTCRSNRRVQGSCYLCYHAVELFNIFLSAHPHQSVRWVSWSHMFGWLLCLIFPCFSYAFLKFFLLFFPFIQSCSFGLRSCQGQYDSAGAASESLNLKHPNVFFSFLVFWVEPDGWREVLAHISSLGRLLHLYCNYRLPAQGKLPLSGLSQPGLQQKGGWPTERNVPLREVRQRVSQLQVPPYPLCKWLISPFLTPYTATNTLAQRVMYIYLQL